MAIETLERGAAEAVAQAKTELLEVFGAMGAMARAADFARVLPRCSAEAVSQALEELAEEGNVEVVRLTGGEAAYHFSRH